MMTCAGPGGGIEPGTAETGAGTVVGTGCPLGAGVAESDAPVPRRDDGRTWSLTGTDPDAGGLALVVAAALPAGELEGRGAAGWFGVA